MTTNDATSTLYLVPQIEVDHLEKLVMPQSLEESVENYFLYKLASVKSAVLNT